MELMNLECEVAMTINEIVTLAYIDPFSATMIIQILIAALIGCAMFFRKWIWRVISIVRRVKRHNNDEEEA